MGTLNDGVGHSRSQDRGDAPGAIGPTSNGGVSTAQAFGSVCPQPGGTAPRVESSGGEGDGEGGPEPPLAGQARYEPGGVP
jgi:hypothetical protein